MSKAASSSIHHRIEQFTKAFGSSSDLAVSSFHTGAGQVGILIFLQGMSDQDKIDQLILPWLQKEGQTRRIIPEDVRGELPLNQIQTVNHVEVAIQAISSGQTALFFHDIPEYFLLGTAKWSQRAMSNPEMEVTITGTREGFTETISVNISLFRRFIRSSQLHVEELTIGTLSKTKAAILYVEGIVDPKTLSEVRARLQEINTDIVLSAGQIQQTIEDNPWSLFPLIRLTDRPDSAAVSVSEGKVAILIDNSPFALLVPYTFFESLQNVDDYAEKWYVATIVRSLRLIALAISMLLPALYIALSHYNPGLIPTDLLISILASRTHVPFPVIWELILMELLIEIFREAGIRLPKPLGQTVGIVGGIVIGDAAVRAGVVSPITLIIVGLTAMASFSAPYYTLAYTFRLSRLLLIIASGALGLYGFMLGILVFLVHLCSQTSFGIPYLSPLAPARFRDWGDMILLLPPRWRSSRPSYVTKARKKGRWRPLKKG